MKVTFLYFFYSLSRFFITKIIYLYQFFFIKRKDLETAVVIGDKSLEKFSILGPLIYDFPIPEGNQVEIFDLKFPSPLIGASFKSEKAIMSMWMRMGLGGTIYKTIMAKKRYGNPIPRLQDAIYDGRKGILNALGLPGPGIDTFSKEILSSELWNFNRPIGVSIGGDTQDEYIENIQKIEMVIHNKCEQYFYELNISCPNTKNGSSICQHPEQLKSLLEEVRKNVNKVISIKVSPDVPNKTLFEIGETVSLFDKIIINAGNTKFVSPMQAGVEESNFSMKGGGLSGAPIFKRTLEMADLFSNFKNPIMATGGISSIHHVNAVKNVGASLFGMATGLVLNPYCIPKINSSL